MKKQTLDTPRDGKAWCDVVNKEPLPKQPTRSVMAIGKCNADGSGFKPYPKPILIDIILFVDNTFN